MAGAPSAKDYYQKQFTFAELRINGGSQHYCLPRLCGSDVSIDDATTSRYSQLKFGLVEVRAYRVTVTGKSYRRKLPRNVGKILYRSRAVKPFSSKVGAHHTR